MVWVLGSAGSIVEVILRHRGKVDGRSCSTIRRSKERLKRRIQEEKYGSVAETPECVVESGNEDPGSYAIVWRRFLRRAGEGTVYRRIG